MGVVREGRLPDATVAIGLGPHLRLFVELLEELID